jgi:hypothetical protein
MAAIGRCAKTIREECTIYALYAGSRLTKHVTTSPTTSALAVTLPDGLSCADSGCREEDEIVNLGRAIELSKLPETLNLSIENSLILAKRKPCR